MVKTLIVEDNDSFRQSLKELLCSRFPSMGVEEAVDGEEALRRIATAVPHIIFMDIKLPGKNGLEVTREIRAKYPAIIIIVLTYYDLPEHREAAFRGGASYFLPKSTSTEDIVELVQSVLSEGVLDSQMPDSNQGSD